MTFPNSTRFGWTEIEQAPEAGGIYAWYARLSISKADIDAAISRIEDAKVESPNRARLMAEDVLDRFVFNPYRESPYQVQLRGALKPRYGGEVSHEPTKSESLVARLADDPRRLRQIAELLRTAAPGFTAPLYIGMAVNLRSRLKQHKRKIIELRDQRTPGGDADDDSVEAGFANQIVARRFDPTHLFVLVAEVEIEASEHNDVENILNRINYPIFGRN